MLICLVQKHQYNHNRKWDLYSEGTKLCGEKHEENGRGNGDVCVWEVWLRNLMGVFAIEDILNSTVRDP